MEIRTSALAGIQYHGFPGDTLASLRAIIRLIECGEVIDEVSLLTCKTNGIKHCFLLSLASEGDVLIKSGFSSGYLGQGPRGLSIALHLLAYYAPNVKIDEHEVPSGIFERGNMSCLLQSDLEQIRSRKFITPYHSMKYQVVDCELFPDILKGDGYFSLYLSNALPLKFIDPRILDLVFQFRKDPDSSIMSAYRRLEDAIRVRAGIRKSDVIGSKLFSKAFRGDQAPLYWKDIEPAEREGRASLFEGAYMAFRNRRAHSEIKLVAEEESREFLLVNNLFVLESEALER